MGISVPALLAGWQVENPSVPLTGFAPFVNELFGWLSPETAAAAAVAQGLTPAPSTTPAWLLPVGIGVAGLVLFYAMQKK